MELRDSTSHIKTREDILKEILDGYKKGDSLLLDLSIRLGKTRIAIELIKVNKPKKVLWVTPNAKLRDIDVPSEFKKWKALNYLKKTQVICHASLSKITGHYDMVVIDEVQHLTHNNTANIYLKKLKYDTIIGLTGTIPKTREKQEILSDIGLIKTISISTAEAIDNKIVAPYKVYLVGVALDNINKNIKSGNARKTFYQTEKQKYTYLCDRIDKTRQLMGEVPKSYYLHRMRFIHNLPSKNRAAKEILSKLNGRTLVFSANIEQSNFLNIPTYNSKTSKENLEAFCREEIDVLGLVNSGGVGYTYQNCDNVLLIQADRNSLGISFQKLGRVLLYRPDYEAKMIILYAKDTVDEMWVKELISDLDANKIVWVKKVY